MGGLYSVKFLENFEYYSDSYNGETVLQPEVGGHQFKIPW